MLRGSLNLTNVAAALGVTTAPAGMGTALPQLASAPRPQAALSAPPPTQQTPVVAAASATPQPPDFGSGADVVNAYTPIESTPAPPAEPTEIVVMHEVRAGDTLSTIAQRYGVSIRSLTVINPLITNPDVLTIGLQILVPTKEGVLLFVRYGDTVLELAGKYKVEPDAIVNFKPNNIPDADSIREGELILIPGGTPPPPPPPPPTPLPTVARPAPVAPAAPAPVARPPAAAAQPVAPARATIGGWIWPISGPLSSYFGPSHPLGIDVDLYGRAGAAIVAGRGGTVTFAGGNACCSYGYYVEIDHGDGFRSIYAHFNAPPPVRIGQTVSQGQVVGYAGTTGYSTGVHLHFEIRRNGAPVNPLGYLP